jgi:RNA polymerase sigma-70 factor (ECF subfamily)
MRIQDDPSPVRDAIDRFERPLVSYALRFVRSAEVAREVVQETFLTLCRQPPHEMNGNLAGWLYTVCRNKALDAQRKEGRMTQLSELSAVEVAGDIPTPPQRLEADESSAAIKVVLATLPANQQEVIRLKFQHNLSYREIASVTGFGEGNVGYLISTGLKTIRARVCKPE